MSKFYTTAAAAEYLGVSAARIRQLIMEDRLKSEKYGRDHLIREAELRAYAMTGKRKPGRPSKKDLRVR